MLLSSQFACLSIPVRSTDAACFLEDSDVLKVQFVCLVAIKYDKLVPLCVQIINVINRCQG